MPYMYCEECGQELDDFREARKCPYCNYENTTYEEFTNSRIEDLEFRVGELEKGLNKLKGDDNG